MKAIDRDYIRAIISDMEKDTSTVPNGVLMEDLKARVSKDFVDALRDMCIDGDIICHRTLNSVMFNIKSIDNGVK